MSYFILCLWTFIYCILPVLSARQQPCNPLSANGCTRYRTLYACEGSILEIECEEGTVINLIRANYGRFSISICNEHGNLDWSVDCTSARSFNVISYSCGFKRNCSLRASSSLFDDPCPGTLKYLEAHYQCLPESKLSTVRPMINGTHIVNPSREQSTPVSVSGHEITQSRPPIIVPLTQLYRSSSTSTTSTTTTTTSTTTTTTTTADNLIPGEKSRESNADSSSSSVANKPNGSQSSDKTNNRTSINVSTSTTISPVNVSPTQRTGHSVTTTVSSTTVRNTPKSSSIIPEISDNNVVNRNVESETMGSIGSIQTFDVSDSPYCPPVTFRDIRWPPTRTGAVTIESCPPPTHGSAKWECTGTATQAAWVAQPDLSDCTSFWIHNLRSRVESGDSVMSVASELAQKTRSTKLYGGDIIQTITVLQTLVSKMGASVGDISEEKRHQLVKDLIQSVIEVSSNILESRNKDGWFDLNVHSRREIASRLIHGLENAALLLAATQNGQYDFNKAHTNVLVSVRLVDAKVAGVKEMHFPTEDTVLNTAWMVMQESLTLPLQTSITSSTSKPGVLKVVFLAYRNVQDFLTPLNTSGAGSGGASQTSSLSMTVPGSVQSHPVSQSTSTVTNSPTKRVINSKVMTLSLVGETNNAFNIRLAQPIQLQFKHLIEENMSNPQCVYWDYNISEWSSDGCWLQEHNRSHTLCKCNHLTSFALLMDISNGKAQVVVEELSHRYILYIGCFISFALITVTLVLLLFFWSSYKSISLIFLCQIFTWIMAIAYLTYDITILAYLFTIGNIGQALVVFIYWWTKTDKLKDGIHKSMSGAPHWLPECIRGSKKLPSDQPPQPGQTAHLFAIAAQNMANAPPSPMIRASGHHHNDPLGQGLDQAKSLQQLSLPYHYWNTKSAGLPPQYEEHKSSGMRHMEDNSKSLLKNANRANSQGFITQGLPSITPDIHLIDSTSYQTQYSPFVTSKSLNRRSLHQQSFGHQLAHPLSGGPVADHHNNTLSNSFGANNLNEQNKSNIIYGRRPGQVIYPGKHGYQIAPEAGDVLPVRPPLPDHIYECIDDECYCFSANSAQQRADYRTKKFYREFESPVRKHRPPTLRNAVIAPAFREHIQLNTGGSERNLLRTIAASVLNSSGNLSANNSPNSFQNNNCNKQSNVCSDFLLDLSCSSNVDQMLSVSNEAIALNNSSSDCSSLDDNTSTDTNNANQRSSQQSMTSTGTEGQNPLQSFNSEFNGNGGSSNEQIVGRSQFI